LVTVDVFVVVTVVVVAVAQPVINKTTIVSRETVNNSFFFTFISFP
jgi:hypothetical protein